MLYPKSRHSPRRHLMLALPVLIVFSLFLAGCGRASGQSELYRHPELDYTVQIPAFWDGKYTVNESTTEEDGIRIASFDYTGSSPEQFVFRIAAYPADVWIAMAAPLNTEQIARDNDYVYAVIRSLDNPYTGEAQQEYGAMAQDTNRIIDTFRLEGQSTSDTGEAVVYFGNSNLNPNADCDLVYPVTRDLTGSPDVPYAALRSLFAGPTAEEQAEGYTSHFSSATADAVRSMTVQSGTAYVNLADIRSLIPNASASCGSAALMAEIESTLRQFPRIQRVIIAIDGSTQAFYDWIQMGCSELNDNCDDGPFRGGVAQ